MDPFRRGSGPARKPYLRSRVRACDACDNTPSRCSAADPQCRSVPVTTRSHKVTTRSHSPSGAAVCGSCAVSECLPAVMCAVLAPLAADSVEMRCSTMPAAADAEKAERCTVGKASDASNIAAPVRQPELVGSLGIPQAY